MTTDELTKEAEEKYSKVDREFIDCQDEGEVFNIGYILGAEPREKQIAELKDEVHTWKEASSANSYKAFQLQEENKTLAQHILELQNDKGNLVDEVKSLKAQIEKMKRCEICKHYRWNHCSYEIKISGDCVQNKLKHFELKEIKEK